MLWIILQILLNSVTDGPSPYLHLFLYYEGQWCEHTHEPQKRAPGSSHGDHHGDLLSTLLAALWDHGSAGHFWSPRTGDCGS